MARPDDHEPLVGAPLSSAQRPLWFSHRRHRGSAVQSTALLTHIAGPVDADRLAYAFAEVVAANDALRTRVVELNGVPLAFTDARPRETQRVQLDQAATLSWARERVTAPLDITSRCYDSVVVEHPDGSVSWYLNLHHLVTDATTSALVFAQTAATYGGEPAASTVFYRSAEETDATTSPGADARRTKASEFWRDRVQPGTVDRLYQPKRGSASEAPRLPVALRPDEFAATLDRLHGDLKALTPDLAWTSFLATVTAVYLRQVAGATSFPIGLSVHNRTDVESRSLIGPLVEVFPIDIEVLPDDTFRSLHKRVSKAVLRTLGNAVAGTAPPADYSVMLNIIPRMGFGSFGDIPTSTTWVHPGVMDSAHLLRVQYTGHQGVHEGVPELALDISRSVAADHHLDRAPAHFHTVLRAMVDDPDQPVAINLVTPDELTEILSWETGTDFPTPTHGLVGQLRTALAARTSVALRDGERAWSGSELWSAATQVAVWLREKGVGPGERVGIELPRSADAVIALLATLLAEGSFVPIDPALPAARRESLARRAGCQLVLRELPSVLPDTTRSPVELSEPADDSEAYLLFTSGSSGEPKGVPITHLGLARYIRFAEDYLAHHPAVASGERDLVVPLFSALSFDLTITSLFLPLVAGGELVVIRPDGPAGLAAVADLRRINWCKATPSHLDILLRLLPHDHSLRTLVIGGEAFGAGLAHRLLAFRPDMAIFNEYGPTEAVVGCMIHRVDAAELDKQVEVPIGRPAPGVSLRIVGPELERVPLGSAGELCIAHVGLTSGYLDSEGPFVDFDGVRFYRSGDLVRLADAKTLVYLGRIDEQVKVGGIRLEPTEVEDALVAHPTIGQAAVRLRTDDDGSRPVLTAWIVPADTTIDTPTPGELRTLLAEVLPRHAIPAAFVPVEHLPLTTNGKLDTAALPAPTRVHRIGASLSDESATGTEAIVIAQAERVLRTEPIGVDDDFFSLGGDSLSALEMMAALCEAFGYTFDDELPFRHRTPRTLAAAIAAVTAAPAQGRAAMAPTALGSWTETAPPPLAAGELDVLFEQSLRPDEAMYNVGRTYHVQGTFDAAQFKAAVTDVASLHVPLSWSYGSTRRHLAPGAAVDFRELSEPVAAASIDEVVRADHRAPFDLENGPLLRVRIIPITDGTTVVFLACHHVSADAESFGRLWKQIDDRMAGKALPSIAVDFPSFGVWQRTQALTHEEHWTTQSQLAAEQSAIAVVRPVPAEPDGLVTMPATITPQALRTVRTSTPFARVIASAAATLRRHSDGDATTIGMITSTRNGAYAPDLFGYFLNTLPVDLEVTTNAPLHTLVEAAGNAIIDNLAHRTTPYADIVRKRRAAGLQQPAARALVAYDDLGDVTFQGLRTVQRVLSNGTAVTDLTFFVEVREDVVDLSIEYRGSIMTADNARALLRFFDNTLTAIVEQPELPLGEVPLPSPEKTLVGPPLTGLPDSLIPTIVENFATRGSSAAVECGGRVLSWSELGTASAVLARRLVDRRVGPGDRVIVHLPRSVDAIAAIVAVLRVGATYIPIDPTYPADRIALLVEGAQARLALRQIGPALTPDDLVVDLDNLDNLDNLDDVTSSADQDDIGVAAHVPDGADVAYIIFTSGSTGRPRGVAVSHANLAASTLARRGVYDTEPDRFVVPSSLAFDSSVVGLFWTLSHGGTIILPTDDEVRDPDLLADLVAGATHTLLVPTLYQAILERGQRAPTWPVQVIVAGEACPASLVKRHYELRANSTLTNEYGPTETTVWATAHHCRVDEPSVAIGRPIPGTWVAVVDTHDYPVPDGVAGELVIGGAGVVVGYLDDRDATAERFAPHHGQPCFRTRDRAVARAGVVEFLGRFDDQLNVGGVRAEPDDIERVLLADPDVAAIAIVAVDPRSIEEMLGSIEDTTLRSLMTEASAASDPGRELTALLRRASTTGQRLVAHIEPIAHRTIDIAHLRALASAGLPAAHRPSIYCVHTALPRSANGKVDRTAARHLPIPTRANLPAAVDHPSGDAGTTAGPTSGSVAALVSELTEVFASVLRVDAIGPDQSFFDEGGHSLLAIELLLELERRYRVDFGVAAIYSNPTPRELAALLAAQRPDQSEPYRYLVPIQPNGSKPPIIGVHVLGINSAFYRPLAARLGSDQPMLGLGFPHDRPDTSAPTDVHHVAAAYADEILRAVPTGPLTLAGVSLGGVVAFELALQLRERGRQVALLVMFDMAGPDIDALVMSRRDRSGLHLREFRRGPRSYIRARAGTLTQRARRTKEVVNLRLRTAMGRSLPDELRVREFVEDNWRSQKSYRFAPYSGSMIVFKAGDDPFTASLANGGMGWADTCTGPLEIEVVSGGHLSMLAEPHVEELAHRLARANAAAVSRLTEEISVPVEEAIRNGLHTGTVGIEIDRQLRRADLSGPEAELVRRLDATTRAISAQTQAVANDALSSLAAASISGRLEPVPTRLQFHRATVRLHSRSDLRPAIEALTATGFEVQGDVGPHSCTVISRDRQTTRIVLVGPDAAGAVHDVAVRDTQSLGVFLGTPLGIIGDVLATARPTANDVVFDLGCGDGRVLVEAARSFGCSGRGVEVDLDLAEAARQNVKSAGFSDRIEIIDGDATDFDYGDATIVFVFLPPEAVATVLPGLLAKLPPGGRIVAHEQLAVDWPVQPTSSHLIVGEGLTVAYVWVKPT